VTPKNIPTVSAVDTATARRRAPDPVFFTFMTAPSKKGKGSLPVFSR
jgi:hypothetical protein